MPVVPQQPISTAPCVVTGNIQLLSAGQIAQGLVIFQLFNIGTGSLPNVLGIGALPNLKLPVMTDQTGNFTTTLWGNDVISPANTQYLVTIRDFLGNEVGPILFNIVGPSFNLNTATVAVGTNPPVYTSTSYASGAAVVPANFALAGWGTGATITNIIGVQQRCQITVTAGVGPVVAPTVTFTYPGPYPNLSISVGQMINGSGSISDLLSLSSTTQTIFTYEGLPVATKTYVFVFDTVGN